MYFAKSSPVSVHSAPTMAVTTVNCSRGKSLVSGSSSQRKMMATDSTPKPLDNTGLYSGEIIEALRGWELGKSRGNLGIGPQSHSLLLAAGTVATGTASLREQLRLYGINRGTI